MGDMKGELVTEVELKCDPHQFFKFWKDDSHNTPNHSPSNIQAVRFHQGDANTPGSIKVWHYTIEGRREVFKERVEVEEEKKLVKLIGLEGDLFKIYKVYNATWHVIPKGDRFAAKIIIEYEKLNPNVSTPHNYLAYLITLTKDIDAGLIANA